MRGSSKNITLFVLLALVALSPLLFPSGFYYRVGAVIFVNAIAVTGIVILTGYAGQVSLGHAGFAGIGAYSCGLMPLYLGIHPGFAMVLGACVSALIAWVVGRPILRLQGYYLGVATLGFGILISMVLTNERDITGGPDGMDVPDIGLRAVLGQAGITLTNGQFWYILSGLAMIIAAWLALNLYNSPTGRALRALHGSEVAARTVGIDVARLKLQAFVISALFASVSGSLLALQNRFVTPDVAGFMHSIEMVTMAVLGGVGSVLGAILGAVILTLLPQVLTVFADYEQIVLGFVMVVMMIFLREGLLPTILKRLKGKDE